MAAEAIIWAAHHRRRELYVGSPTAGTILVSKFWPGLVDRFLARTGYDSQQTETQVEPNRPNNLFEPLPGDYGTHGPFDARARGRSLHFWATTHLGWPAMVDMLAGLFHVIRTFLCEAVNALRRPAG
jgi:hypothetical protein